MNQLVKSLNALNENIGRAVSWLTFILVLLFVYDVMMRYLFNTTAVWIGEMEWHLFSLIFLLAGGYALKNDKHVRVDVFYQNFSPKRKAWVNLLGGLLFLLPWSYVVIYSSFNYASVSFGQMEGSPNPGGLPFRFLIKGSIFVGFIFLFLQGIATVVESFLIISGRNPPTENHEPATL